MTVRHFSRVTALCLFSLISHSLTACSGGTTSPPNDETKTQSTTSGSTAGGSAGGTTGNATGSSTGKSTGSSTGTDAGSTTGGGGSCEGDFSLGQTFMKGNDYFDQCNKVPPTNCVGGSWVTFAGKCFCAIPCSDFQNISLGDSCDQAGNYVCTKIQATNAGANSATWCVAKSWNLCAASGGSATGGDAGGDDGGDAGGDDGGDAGSDDGGDDEEFRQR